MKAPRTVAILVLLTVLISGCQTAQTPPREAVGSQALDRAASPPVATVIPKQLVMHGHTRIDDYYWLRERENPEVLAYLEAENAYTEAMMADTEELQQQLFEEIKDRVKQSDESVPYLLDGYYYYTRTEEDKAYPVHCRRKGSLQAEEEIMLDVNELAADHPFCSVSGVRVSSGNDILAYAIDTVGRRKYTIVFKNLTTGETLPDTIPEVTSNLAWATDNQTLFYTKQDPETLRYSRIYRHRLGSDPATDPLVYEEEDETFSAFVGRSRSKRFIMIAAMQTLTSEYQVIDAARPDSEPVVLQPRQRGLEYQVDHLGDSFYIRTNLDAENFRMMKTPVSSPGKESWQEIIPHREQVLLESYAVFQDFLVVCERRDGLRHLRVIPWDGSPDHEIELGETAYVAMLGENPRLDTTTLRYQYTSMTTPWSTYDYDMATHERNLLKQEEVLGGFDPADYVTERLFAEARDGSRVPISLVSRKGLHKDGSNPLLLYAYGGYGYSTEPYFSSNRLSLLDRGVIYAIAHVRGGQELGRHWYEDGKLLKKKNTFTDFIDCARLLVDQGYTAPDRLFAWGGSAGGLTVGAVSNMAPELFAGIIASVPWVDVVTTMLDHSVPLTTAELDEWGDPTDKEYYDYQLSYSPYDNVSAQAYPSMLITTGLHDSQVQYWEPAKWAAKLRALKTDDNLLLLKINMEAGHGGASGRFKAWQEMAFYYAFILKVLDRNGVPTSL